MIELLTLLVGQKLPVSTLCRRRNRIDLTTSRPPRASAHLVGFLTFAVGAAVAAAAPARQFASGVDLVDVYASVTDARGEPVAGLTAGDFHVLEEGEPQTIAAFAAGTFPLSIAIGLDRSFSMRTRLAEIKGATRSFVAALRPEDRVMIVAIGSDTEIVSPLSADRAAAARAIDRLDAWGTTPLYDAALAAIDEIQSGKGRRALVLVSDGIDRYSETTPTSLIGRARERDVLVYPIAIGGARPPVFVELATVTGGRSVFVNDARELASAFAGIARDLRFQYLLGYSPRRKGAEGEWRSIVVTVDRPNLRVRARDGYVSR
jgi:Ca-activated chloride channel family protein